MIILCVDDDADDVQVFCDAVKQVNISAKCIVAYNGQQALDILQSGLLPDKIFLDINMPILNGFDTLKSIRRDKRFKKIPVIIYSTHIDPKEIGVFKSAGADQLLAKPARFNDLCESLSSIIDKPKTD